MDLTALAAANAARWLKAKATRDFSRVAKRLVSAKAVYQRIETQTGVPWYIIAVIHEREAAQDFHKSIAQGDPWDKTSTHVPAGRGPFTSFEEAAYDALVHCAPHAAANKDWSAGGALTLLERYNGTGYASKGLPSPYIWSGTDQYKSGKYVADHVFDPNKVDEQLGCAGLLIAMAALDSSAHLPMGGYVPEAPKATPAPPQAAPKPSLLSVVLDVLLAIFKRK